MRMTKFFVFFLAVAGCAAQRPAPSVTPPPMAERAPAYDVSSVPPFRKPTLSVRTPALWTEIGSHEAAPEADIVLVHASGKALIAVQLRNTDERTLADHAERMVGAAAEGVTTSPIMTTAGGNRAWFSWTRHPSRLRPVPAQGKVILVRFPTMPERMAVVTGTWPPEMNVAMVTDLNDIAASVLLL